MFHFSSRFVEKIYFDKLRPGDMFEWPWQSEPHIWVKTNSKTARPVGPGIKTGNYPFKPSDEVNLVIVSLTYLDISDAQRNDVSKSASSG